MNALVAKLIRHDWFIRMSSRYSEVVPDLAACSPTGLCRWLVLTRQSAAHSGFWLLRRTMDRLSKAFA